MVTMIDEIFDRDYQAGRAALNASLNRAGHDLARTIGDGLRVLHRLEWTAPWARHAPPPHCR